MHLLDGRWVVFTDLDGSLLDHATYRWQEARPAIEALRGARVPLVIVTSKTRAEVMPLLRTLGLLSPFAAENGGAIYVPRDYFSFHIPGAVPAERGWLRVARGLPRARLIRQLSQAAHGSGVEVRLFSGMSLSEVVKRTGLAPAAARWACQREFDEPFVMAQGNARHVKELQEEITRRGLMMTRGSRFFHILGRCDKGLAVRQVVGWFKRAMGGRVQSMGLGDSPNDIPLLRAVDIPVVVARPSGRYDVDVLRALPRCRRAGGKGPAGWNRAVLQVVRESLSLRRT